jgi:hypothetical protein
MMKTLVQTLNAVGKATEIYESPDGSKVLILPYGGRILGLFGTKSHENFFWTNPVLASVESARAFYESDAWHNSGGDRTWLAPEADIFFPNFPKLDKYWQQRQLDPGNYRLEGIAEGPRLVNDLRLTLSRSQREMGLRMTKSVSPALNPLRYERLPLDVEYAGYTLRTSLELSGADLICQDRVGLWNLLQLPHGGDMWIPTYSKSQPNLIMGSVAADDLAVGERLIQYKMRATGEDKIGIRAVATAGRVGYLYQTGDQPALVIRNFFVNPSGEYVDVPWNNAGDFGYSTQACNIKGNQGPFSELEYHSPAIGYGTGRTRCVDESQVWAFRGASAQIQLIAQTLLSPTI